MTLIKIYRKLILAIAIASMSNVVVFGQSKIPIGQQADSTKVLETTNKFLASFRNLEWDSFTAYFAEDATAFFPPSARQPYRANNKSEITNIFRVVFENARKGRTSAPYLDIEPKDIKIQVSGQVAVVTFTLNDPDMLSRRTLVWKNSNGTWVIIHLHASGIPFSGK